MTQNPCSTNTDAVDSGQRQTKTGRSGDDKSLGEYDGLGEEGRGKVRRDHKRLEGTMP